jgi:hypothetical protein
VRSWGSRCEDRARGPYARSLLGAVLAGCLLSRDLRQLHDTPVLLAHWARRASCTPTFIRTCRAARRDPSSHAAPDSRDRDRIRISCVRAMTVGGSWSLSGPDPPRTIRHRRRVADRGRHSDQIRISCVSTVTVGGLAPFKNADVPHLRRYPRRPESYGATQNSDVAHAAPGSHVARNPEAEPRTPTLHARTPRTRVARCHHLQHSHIPRKTGRPAPPWSKPHRANPASRIPAQSPCQAARTEISRPRRIGDRHTHLFT